MAYSEDFRKRVIEYRKEGHTFKETREVFKIATDTIQKWEKKLKEEGTLKRKPVKRSFRKLDPEKVTIYFEEHPDAYLREAAEEFSCCETTITNACRKLKITRKKKATHYGEQSPEKVAEFEEKIRKIPKGKRVYIDEAGFDSYLYHQYARAPRGTKIHEKVRGRKYQRISIVASQIGHDIIAPLEYTGTMHGDFFETWFEEHLLPAIPEGSAIILDNASFHRKKRLYEIAERNNQRLIFLPPYSPELNTIEHFWHWLKKTVANTLRVCSDFALAIITAFQMW